ncbi:ATP-binding protein [Kordia periserrulae]|nr:ATP-binding protein [Kordia periserrulae]
MAKALYKKATNFKELDSFKVSYEYFRSAKDLYEKIDDSLQVAKSLLEISTIDKKTGSFGLSQTSALEGLKYVKKSKNIKIKSKLYFNIAVAAKERGDLLNAENRINQALDLAKDSVTTKKVGYDLIRTFLNTKANIFKEKENYEGAIEIYNNILSESSKKLSQTQRARFNGNLAHTLFLKNGLNKKSDSLLQESLIYYEKINNISGLVSIYMKLAEMYVQRDKQKVLNYTKKIIELADKLDNDQVKYEAYEQLITIDAKSENIAKYLKIKKEVNQKRNRVQSEFANAKFNYDDEKEQKIEAQNAAIKADNLASKKENQVLILLLILIVLIVLTFFIYQRIQRRHKIEKVKTVHVTEARISSKVHDELANDLYELMTQLETTDPEKEVVLDKLDTIYNQARDISKQIQTVETDDTFPDELSNLFRSYQSDEVNVLLKRYDTDIWKGISSHIKVTVYRVLQEFLTNMKKHSNAALVVVSIEKQNKQLFIQYIDNGKGFTAKTSKNGLRNAENRIRAIKGKLTFDTELDKGCKFSINVPV